MYGKAGDQQRIVLGLTSGFSASRTTRYREVNSRIR